MNHHLKNGLFFTAIGKFSNMFIMLLVNAVLSRLLTPQDYGVVAIVQVFILFFQVLIEAGMGPAIIQNKSLDKKDIGILFNYSVIIAVFLSLIFGFFGQILAYIYDNSIYIKLSWLQAISIFFNGLNVVPSAILNKEKKFKIINLNQIISGTIGGIVGVSLALSGKGVYALIWSAISISIVFFFLNIRVSNIEFTKNIDVTVMKKILNFSLNQFSFNFINYFSRNSDNILIGKFMGPADLGNYNKAYQLLMLPNSLLLGVINPVLQPVLSDYQDDVIVIKNTYLKIFRFLALIGISLSVYLFLFSKEVIFFVFGNQWDLAVIPFKFLATTVWIQMTLSSTGAIFQSRNKAKELFTTGLLSALVLVSSIIIGILTKDLNKLAMYLTLGFYVNYILNFSRVMKLALDDNLITLMKELKIPFIIGISEFFVLLITKNILPINLNSFIKILISGTVSAFCFFIMCILTKESKKILILFGKK